VFFTFKILVLLLKYAFCFYDRRANVANLITSSDKVYSRYRYFLISYPSNFSLFVLPTTKNWSQLHQIFWWVLQRCERGHCKPFRKLYRACTSEKLAVKSWRISDIRHTTLTASSASWCWCNKEQRFEIRHTFPRLSLAAILQAIYLAKAWAPQNPRNIWNSWKQFSNLFLEIITRTASFWIISRKLSAAVG